MAAHEPLPRTDDTKSYTKQHTHQFLNALICYLIQNIGLRSREKNEPAQIMHEGNKGYSRDCK